MQMLCKIYANHKELNDCEVCDVPPRVLSSGRNTLINIQLQTVAQRDIQARSINPGCSYTLV